MTDLVSWTDLKSALSLDDEQETEAKRLISIATSRAEHYTGRTLGSEEVTRQYSGNNRRLLVLSDWPVVEIASVYIDQDMDFGSDTEVTDYKVRDDIGALYRAVRWPEGTGNVKVIGTFGYETVPEDLQESIIQLVGYWLDSPTVGWVGSGSLEDGGYQNRYIGVGDLPFQVRQVWDLYRKVKV